ncbi:hypothetical protein CONCODRAFT_18121 [Conidiobolus coronatus NRRL 28638]|uniref:Uncharacterized protein n=1 Tax=Conidiobolus coronatus (strain ATCC 28846 / CBS 209.66 / NRRL 28638) TaxID=796925 RepID=A0A137P3X7_CONC2|nr:hypothetical protein CONCODRAFT_18121 [Conidiobolus coronatus NRRL 28638]|eukprot:KXN69720.1 hypothetical protein CONCODRAFT_18121 [Conidiobolus coronatus NRRL 28638]
MKVLIEEISSTSQINQLEDLVTEIDTASPASIELLDNSTPKKFEYIRSNEKLLTRILDYAADELKELELNHYYSLTYNLIYYSQILSSSSLYSGIVDLLDSNLNYLIKLEKLEDFQNFTIIKEIKPKFGTSTTSSNETKKTVNISKLVNNSAGNEIEVDEQKWKISDCRAYYYLNWIFSLNLENYNIAKIDDILLNHLPFTILLMLDYEPQYKLTGLNQYLLILNTVKKEKLKGRGIPLILKQNYSTFLGFINDQPDLFKALINTFLKLINILEDGPSESEEFSEILIRKVLLYAYFTFDNNLELIQIVLTTLINIIKSNSSILILDFEQIIKLSISVQSSLKFNKLNNSINLEIIKLNAELLTLIIESKLKKSENFPFEVFSSSLKIWYFSISLYNKSLENSLSQIQSELNRLFNTLINAYSDKTELFKNDINQFLSHPLLNKYITEFDWVLEKLN